MDISLRLKTVAQALTPGFIPADIGTDHGYVPIYLVKQGVCPKAFAMDINPGPLSRARDHIAKEGLGDRIITRLSNGLEKLDPQEVDSIIIAGMGGALICRILAASPEFMQTGKELILSPQAEWFKVRQFLHEHHYVIKKEWFLKEEGKYYVVIKARPGDDQLLCKEEKLGQTSHGDDPSPFDDETCYQYGKYLLEEKNPILFEYLEKERQKMKRILAGLKEQGKEETDRYRELSESIMVIDHILKT